MSGPSAGRISGSLSAWPVELLLWAANLTAVFFATRFLFEKNSRGLFGLGWDQQAYQAFLGTWHRFAGVSVGVGMDPVDGMGNIAFPYDPTWHPSYWIAAGPAGFIDNWPLSFAVAATELFAVTAICGRLHGIPLALSLVAGWLLTLLTWPIYAPPKIIALWLYTPQIGELVCVALLMTSAAFHLGQGGLRRTLWLSLAIFAGITYFIFARPLPFVIAIVPLAMGAAAGLVFAPDRQHRMWILACWAAIGVTCLACGYVHYLAGLFSYTAAGTFPDLGKRLPTLYSGEATLLLWSPFSDLRSFFDEPVRVLLAGGLAGSMALAVAGTGTQRRFGWGLLVTETVLITIGLSNYKYNYWFGPTIWYFEMYLLPFFALACAYLIALPAMLPWRAFARWGGGRWLRVPAVANIGLALVLPVAGITHASKVGSRVQQESRAYVGYDMGSDWPQPESVVTRLLKSEIGLAPGRPFRGRVVTMLGRKFPQERYWGHYSLVHYIAQFATGNLHDGPGLWQDDIPTVFEYSSLITPASFALVRVFLTEPDEIVLRNLIATRRFDARVLRMLGARFVLTDAPLEGLALRSQLDIPVTPATRKRLGFEKYEFDRMSLYLYELAGTNHGQFSPTQVRVARDANEIITLLSDEALDPAETLIVSEPIAGELAPATLQEFTIDRDRYRVRATSNGRSVLLLPAEFSRCLRIERYAGTEPRLMRGDLMLMAIVFEKQLDAEIAFRAGPFGASRCRLQDAEDARRLAMADAFRDRPQFGKLGWQDYWNKK